MKALELIPILEEQAAEIASSDLSGWGNTMILAAAELRRLAAVEAELEHITALKPVAWALRFDSDPRLCLSCVFDTEKEANEYAEQINSTAEVVPLNELGSKND